MKYPERKPQRIKNFDYSSQNYYFVTICTIGRKHIFGSVNKLNFIGRIAENELKNIPEHFKDVAVERYVIMPNHMHAIIKIGCTGEERSRPFPTLSTIVGLYKSGVTRIVHQQYPDVIIWQKSFYDHIIRNEEEYTEICRYIDENPLKWADDEYYL